MILTSFPLYGKDQMSKCSFFCVDLAVTYKQIAVVLILAAIQPSGHVAFLACLSQREVHTYGNILAQKVEI